MLCSGCIFSAQSPSIALRSRRRTLAEANFGVSRYDAVSTRIEAIGSTGAGSGGTGWAVQGGWTTRNVRGERSCRMPSL